MIKIKVWLVSVFIITLLTINNVNSVTTQTGPKTFSGTMGYIDTGYRSYEISNTTGSTVDIYFNEIVKVYTDTNILNKTEYLVSWEFCQTNSFQNMSISSANGIRVDIDITGFRENKSSIVWRLQILSNFTETINVDLKITLSLDTFIEVPMVASSGSLNETNEWKDRITGIFIGVVITVIILLLLRKIRKIRSESK
ncbi:MAG: hypothetical protein INQ03_08330 [Candidatus Heimdallarchaeota archaeon]|nr:hypothetical protein [Candidatus Heimdallarchaeota archaeon]